MFVCITPPREATKKSLRDESLKNRTLLRHPTFRLVLIYFSAHNVRSSSTISFSRDESDEGIFTFNVT